MAPSRTHQVEEMLPQVLWEVGRGLQEAALHGESISKLSHVAITARSKVGGSGVWSLESHCIVNRIKGAGKPHLSLTNVSPGHWGAGPPPAALRE